MKSPQATVYQNVAQRGYTDGYTDQEFASRQLLKIIEEVAELADSFGIDESMTIATAGAQARYLFDAGAIPFTKPTMQAVQNELYDVQVVLFCMAEALGIDVIAGSVQKSLTDIERGVRKT